MATEILRMQPPPGFAHPEFDFASLTSSSRGSPIAQRKPSLSPHYEQPIAAAASRAFSLTSRDVASRTSTFDAPSTAHPSLENIDLEPTSTVNEDLGGLADILDEAKIQTVAPSTSKAIEVQNGFPLGLAFDLSTFYNLRSELRKHDKRKRELGVLPEMNGRQKHGFRPEELLWYGAIDLKDCKDSTLDNDIHPLLQRDCFDDTPDHIYDQMAPGLRLASLFLSHPSCMQFWVTLAKGERRIDHEMSRRYGMTRHRISSNVPMTDKNVTEVVRYMRDLGQAKPFHFTFADALVFKGDAAFGTAHPVCHHMAEVPQGRQSEDIQRCQIRLHSDFYIVAKKLSMMHYPDPAQKLRYNFHLATIIMHELAHAMELSQWRNRAPSPYEPFLFHHNEAELGRVWETCMFGGTVSPINDRVDSIYGVATWNWPQPFGEMNPERTIVYAVPMSYIEKIQQKDMWKQHQRFDHGNPQPFRIPRDGAISIYMTCVTTVSWTEEERVAKEALNEQQIQEQDAPARKRREAADGHAVGIKDIGTEPESVETPEKPVEVENSTTVQQVVRAKKEPVSVLSRKRRRQQKKFEQKHLQQRTLEAKAQEEGKGNLIPPSTESTKDVVEEKADEAVTLPDNEKTTKDDIGVIDGKTVGREASEDVLYRRVASNKT
ncbi:MAG: hypothetical protein Q9183_002662 [Haloplaca sp. 2 TL-2023]